MFHNTAIFRAARGYRKVSLADPVTKKLAAFLCPIGTEVAVSVPMTDTPGLFRIFAAVADEESAYVEFANQFGTLGAYDDLRYIPTVFHDHELPDTEEARISYKRDHHWELRDRDSLENWRYYRTQMGSAVRALDRCLSDKGTEEDRELIEAMIEAYLPDYVELLPRFDQSAGRLKLRPTPRCLLGAMWLQLSLSYLGEREIRSCPICGKWFAVEKTRGKTRQELCGVPCRTRAYRDRRAKAFELLRKGMKPGEIAAELDVDIASVRGWIKKQK